MLELKDFAVGDSAFILTENMGRNTQPEIKETTVKKVGRKYVTIDNWSESQFIEGKDEYLREKVSYGEARLLFKNIQDVETYIEKKELARWLRCTSVSKSESYSLEQLRKVKEILEPQTLAWDGECRTIEVFDRNNNMVESFVANDKKLLAPRVYFYRNGKEVSWYDKRACYHKEVKTETIIINQKKGKK